MQREMWHSGFLGRLSTIAGRIPVVRHTIYRQLVKIVQLQKQKIRRQLKFILGVSGYTIHDIINNAETRCFVYQEYKFIRRIEREHLARKAKQEMAAAERFDVASEYWKQGVLPPWDGGPKTLKQWWSE
jgi:DNA polymerase III alpha subunit